ncbi:MAG: type IIL restriction-modification enzyme MmeI [Pirellulaceae bacterium]
MSTPGAGANRYTWLIPQPHAGIPPLMTPAQFIAKWQAVNLSERSACQKHFLDLCELLGQPKPAEADPAGAWYCFEKGVKITAGGDGWADVWMQGRFGWEYKGKHKDLVAAYKQLRQYREALENPPLLVVCDLDRFEIHTQRDLLNEPASELSGPQRQAIAAAAKELDDLRTAWLNPPEWTRTETLEFPGSEGGPWARYIVGWSLRDVPGADAAQGKSPFAKRRRTRFRDHA